MKLDSLMGKVTASAAQKIQAKAEILKDKYGERKGTTYDFGLEAANDEVFLGKLNPLNLGFSNGFVTKGSISFLKA